MPKMVLSELKEFRTYDPKYSYLFAILMHRENIYTMNFCIKVAVDDIICGLK